MLLLSRLWENKNMVNMEDSISRKTQSGPNKLFKPTISLAQLEMDELELSKYGYHTYHNTPEDNTSEKYVIEILKFGCGTPEEWIIFLDLVQRSTVGQNDTTIYPCTSAQKGC